MAEKYTGIRTGNTIKATDMETALDRKEEVSNKKGAITDSSTEYPSSKAVYTALSGKSDAGHTHSIYEAKQDKLTAAQLAAVESGITAAKVQTYDSYTTQLSNLVFFPKGTILTFNSDAWNGASAAFKNIWKVCNGQNSTPDLRNKFLRGGESSGATGTGKKTLSQSELPAHTHGVNDPGHSHTTNASLVSAFATFPQAAVTGYIVSNASISSSVTNISIESAGNGQEFDIIPAFYTVIYIMKVA